MSDQDTMKLRMEEEMRSMTGAIIQMIERFKNLQSPIVETHQSVPQATEQLDKISEQTMAAANRVLDSVEHITQREQAIINGLLALKMELGETQPHATTMIDTLIEQANAIINDAYTIMTDLQFQDITAQQINYAASMLEEFQTKLQNLTHVMQQADVDFSPGAIAKTRSFDPNADLFKKSTNQAEVDSIFSKKK